MHDTSSRQPELIEALVAHLSAQRSVERFETHLSWILVTGGKAWKFKKALRLDFVDFSTLAARRFYCEQELRLNRRLAPALYLGVDVITGSVTAPVIGGSGEPIEYALRMQAFEQQALWIERVDCGSLSSAEVDALAMQMAAFHQDTDIAPSESDWGSAAAVCAIADDNLATIAGMAGATATAAAIARLAHLTNWQQTQQRMLAMIFDQRKVDGFVRECHGDLHCGNIVTLAGVVLAFDCIEFSEPLRWIDVMSDIAFICMDLDFRGLPALAARLLDCYLAQTGDYAGVAVLPYYRTQRALVRAKIACLRADQQPAATPPPIAGAAAEAARYLAFAVASTLPRPRALIITHGFSGSGKSTLSQHLLELSGAIRLRSDVERKRMAGHAAGDRMAAPVGEQLYAASASEATYVRLALLARQILDAGLPVIVDAAFLQYAQRKIFKDLAGSLGLPFFIVDLQASPAILQQRIVDRMQLQGAQADASDAGPAVLAHQRVHHDPLGPAEMPDVVVVDANVPLDRAVIARSCAPVLQVLDAVLDAVLDTSHA